MLDRLRALLLLFANIHFFTTTLEGRYCCHPHFPGGNTDGNPWGAVGSGSHPRQSGSYLQHCITSCIPWSKIQTHWQVLV